MPRSTSRNRISPNLPPARRRIYTREQLIAYDLLAFPVWVFDIENTKMWWANGPACYLWNAPDCDTLCQRDFASGNSKSTEQSMRSWLEAFREGQTKTMTWTFHPNQGKCGPKTCELLASGIYVSDKSSSSGCCDDDDSSNNNMMDDEEEEEEGHLCMLIVIQQVIDGTHNNKAEETKIRRTEMMRHFPIVARQFNLEGKLMDQNPQANATFGSPDDAEPSETIMPKRKKGHHHHHRRHHSHSPPPPPPSRENFYNNKNIPDSSSPLSTSTSISTSSSSISSSSDETTTRQQEEKVPLESVPETDMKEDPTTTTSNDLKNGKNKLVESNINKVNERNNNNHNHNHNSNDAAAIAASAKSPPPPTPPPPPPPPPPGEVVDPDHSKHSTNPAAQGAEIQSQQQQTKNLLNSGSTPIVTNKKQSSSRNASNNNNKKSTTSTSTATTTTNKKRCDFLAQFVNLEVGKEALREVSAGRDYSTETQQITLEGPKWFTVNVRGIQDPVTSEPAIIYSGRDITKVMEAARLEADKQNMRRNEFFAVMAHEIRTPLHQVVGFIELLASSGLNAEQTESVDMLQSSAHALMAIINDLLDFTKLEAGKMKLEIIPFEVRGVLDGSVAAVQPQAHEKGLVVKCNVDQKIPIKMLGDPNRLRQVVLNMLTNAVKFTKKGEIIVESQRVMEETGGQMKVRFSVKDSGIGIPKDKCKRIFNPYQQADASVSRNYGGTGLGLAICKSLVEKMGGQIGVDSELGKGTTFWFEIPFGIFQGHHQEANDTDSQSTDDLINLRILVAEDNKVNQKVVVKMLSRLGHDSVVVQNGQEAVTAITENQEGEDFDIVLMDWQMPVMDGIDATKEIRRKGFSMSKLPIVGLTASIQGLDWYSVGMNDCLRKPVRIADLKSALAKNMN